MKTINYWLLVALALHSSGALATHSGFPGNPTGDTATSQLNLVPITDSWAFQYRYDARKRLIAKKVPGGGWEYTVYDKRDRVVLTQNAAQRQERLWAFIKYDVTNRPILTGIKDTSVALTQAEMQSVVDRFYGRPLARWGEVQGSAVHGYTNMTYPLVADPDKYLTATFYDNYAFKSTISNSARLDFFLAIPGEQANANVERIAGMLTGSKMKVLDGGTWGGTSWLTTATYYDDKLRAIQTVSDNLKGGTDRSTSVFDFEGKVRKVKTVHNESDLTWINRSGITLVGNKIIKTNETSAWSAGAASLQVLSPAVDGWVETECIVQNAAVVLGLNDTSPDATLANINYAAYLNGTTLAIYENNTQRLTSTLVRGDIVRIERTGTTVRYKKNGVVIYTSATPSSTSLVADISMLTPQALLKNVRASFSTTSHTITRRMEYDHSGRLLRTWHQLDSQNPVLLGQNEYNEIGQLVDRKLHSDNGGQTFAQSLDFRYNIRGWLTSVNGAGLVASTINDDNNDLFGIDLVYDATDAGLRNIPQFNGNISCIQWSNNLGLGEGRHGYTYSYDKLNRIGRATFKIRNPSWVTPPLSAFSEGGYSYDLNGNILNLSRRGAGGALIDSLSYNYGAGQLRSNRLLSVTDRANPYEGFSDVTGSGPDYTYDADGNMLTDQNKGITGNIVYNYLKLPELVTRGGNAIRYIYDAGGRKLGQVTSYSASQKSVDYVGEYQYEDDVLQFINHEEGRIILAQRRQVFKNDGDNMAGVTSSNVSLTQETRNGGQTYLVATATSATPSPGIQLGAIAVSPGDKYLIRLNGYRTGTTGSVHISLKVNGLVVDWPGATLPAGLSAESWTEQFLIVPSGGSTLSLGVSWNGSAAAGNSFFVNDFEVVKLTTTVPEYQYDLKDHLGNVRMTFTTKKEVEQARATLEPANEVNELGAFLRYDKVRKVMSHLFDHTNGSAPSTTTGYAQRLSGTSDERIGLAKSLSVMPGDTVRMEVFAKYVDQNPATRTAALNTLMSYLVAPLTAPAGVLVDGAGYAGNGAIPIPWAQVGAATSSSIDAGLNYIMFDRDFNPIFDPTQTNFVRLSDAPRERGQDVAHERLFAEILIKQPGYLYVYLSNDESQPLDVYFDDFKVVHAKGPVVQSQEYYPFGEMFNISRRENSTFQERLYNNGSDLKVDLDLNVYETQFRTFDPVLGRWWQVDSKPDAGGQESISPYQYSYNNPIRYNDPNGDCPPISSCAALTAAASADAAANPNGVGAHAIGFAQGLLNSAQGLVNSVTDPGGTAKGLGNLALAGIARNPVAAMQIDAALGTNSYGTLNGLTDAIATGASKLINGNGQERGQVLGEIGGAILGTKGIGTGFAALRNVATAEGFLLGGMSLRAPINIPVQRFGAMSIAGESAFGLRTGSSPFVARTFNAILPKWNNLSNYTTGTIPKGTPIRIGITAPQGLRFPGGLLQINVRPKLVINQSTKLVN